MPVTGSARKSLRSLGMLKPTLQGADHPLFRLDEISKLISCAGPRIAITHNLIAGLDNGSRKRLASWACRIQQPARTRREGCYQVRQIKFTQDPKDEPRKFDRVLLGFDHGP